MAGIGSLAGILREAFYVVFITRAEKAATFMAFVTPVIASSLLLGGCMSSPTYGTDKTATEQLLSDVSNIASVQSKRKAPIDYKPRPELVRPAKGEDLTQLPAPQDDVTSSTNPDWPELPEQRRTRLVNEINENRDKPGFEFADHRRRRHGARGQTNIRSNGLARATEGKIPAYVRTPSGSTSARKSRSVWPRAARAVRQRENI